MTDISWLSQEAKTLHALFSSFFYGFALVLMLIGVVTEYFKFTIGGTPQFAHLAGRVLIAAVLLTAYPEISNLTASVFDSLANQVGSLNAIMPVLSKYWAKLKMLQLSWTSVKDSVLMLISFVVFFLLYISVYIADAAITYAWILLYVFSPILIALYVHPATAGATKTLFRSLFEVGAWKVVWSVLATLLWSSALTQINDPQNSVNFITAVSLNLILAASLLMTPFVVNALAGAGIASLAAQTAGLAAGASFFSPGNLMAKKLNKSTGSKKNGNSQDSSTESDSSGDGFMRWENFQSGHHFKNKFSDAGSGPNNSTPSEKELEKNQSKRKDQKNKIIPSHRSPENRSTDKAPTQVKAPDQKIKTNNEPPKKPVQLSLFNEKNQLNTKPPKKE